MGCKFFDHPIDRIEIQVKYNKLSLPPLNSILVQFQLWLEYQITLYSFIINQIETWPLLIKKKQSMGLLVKLILLKIFSSMNLRDTLFRFSNQINLLHYQIWAQRLLSLWASCQNTNYLISQMEIKCDSSISRLHCLKSLWGSTRYQINWS